MGAPLPELWIIGSFSLTGAEIPRHSAQLAAGMEDVGGEAKLISVNSRAFAEHDLAAMLAAPPPKARPALALYVQSALWSASAGHRGFLARLRGLGAYCARWMRLLRLAARSERILLLEPTRRLGLAGIINLLVTYSLLAAFLPKARLARQATAPDTVIQRLTMRRPEPTRPAIAEERAFAKILAARPEGQRMSAAHWHRAAELCPQSSKFRADLDTAIELSASTTREEIEAACGRAAMDPASAPSAAIRACLAPDAAETPGIVAHLARTGQRKRARRLARFREISLPCHTLTRLITGTSGSEETGRLHGPIGGDPDNLSLAEAAILLALRAPMQSVAAFRSPWKRRAWALHLAGLFAPGHPARRTASPPPRLRLHGHLSGETGLTRNLWMSMSALSHAGIAHEGRADQPGADMLSRPVRPQARVAQNVALYHLNADRLPEALFAQYRHISAFHIGFLLWELDRLPQTHRLALDCLDEIWVPSVFLQRLYQPHFKGKTVLMRKGIALPAPRRALPPPLARRPGKMRFLLVFDANSSTMRKNPLAAVKAFHAAFGAPGTPFRKDVELVIKYLPAPKGHWGDSEGQLDAIHEYAAQDPRLILHPGFLPFETLLGLIESADAVLSPHRAEGFGYIPAFALALARPVIATDYSGTRDFLTEETGFPVPYGLAPVPKKGAMYPTPGAKWAEIDIGAMADAMRAVYSAPQEALARALQGQSQMKTLYTIPALSRRYHERLRSLGLIRNAQAEIHPGLKTGT